MGWRMDGPPVTASPDIPNVFCTPQASLAFSKPQTHPRAGLSQEQAWAHGMPLGSKETNLWLSHIETWRKGLFPLLGHSSHRDLLGEEKQDDTRLFSPENPSPAAKGKEQELLQKAGIAQGCFHNGIAQVSHLLSTFCTMGQVERVKNNVPKKSLTAPKPMRQNLQKSEECDRQTCFSKAERSKTAAMLTFASRLDTSVNISEAGSHQQQRLVQPACRLKQTLLHQITLKMPSTFSSDPEIQFKNDPMVILMKAEIPCVQGEKWEDTWTRWANPNKSYFICILIKGWALKLSWSVILNFPN